MSTDSEVAGTWVRSAWREAGALIRANGLNPDGLDGAEEPSASRRYSAADARELLTAYVRRSHQHNRVFLPVDLAEMETASEASPLDLPSGWLTEGFGVLRLPPLETLDGTSTAGRSYAEALDAAVRALGPEAEAWLVDLTGNGGGNMYPMIAGLAALLGPGRHCGFEDREGNQSWVELCEASVVVGGNAMAAVPDPTVVDPRPVAVLIAPATASSGEFVALSLASRCEAVLVGEPSAGYLTGVEAVSLPSGGAVALTGARAVDRHGAVWPEALVPHISCAPPTVDRALPLLGDRR